MTRYRGRFAPSPTGPLHLGSLFTAVASFVDARANQGVWLVRIEDVDQARVVPGAADLILRQLEAFGLHWDETPVYQSQRTHAYAEALETLRALRLTYPCGCTRADLACSDRRGPEGPIYPGTCRSGIQGGRPPRSLRFRVAAGTTTFEDRIQGRQQQVVSESVGDFVLRRADGFHAYQLAVVVDDAWQGIDQILRGADLLLSTPRQLQLQRTLGFTQPSYAHVPLILDPMGRKLSKSLASAPVDGSDPLPALRLVWSLLGQTPLPSDLAPREVWDWAIPRWDIAKVPTRSVALALG